MEKVKLFSKSVLMDLEANINRWLEDRGDAIEIVDRQMSQSSIHQTDDDPRTTVTIAIFYKAKNK
jgi:hypothetical protein